MSMEREILSFADFRARSATSDSAKHFYNSLALFTIKQYLRGKVAASDDPDEWNDAGHLLGFIGGGESDADD